MQPTDFPKFLMSYALVTSVNIALGAFAERASWLTYLLYTFIWAGARSQAILYNVHVNCTLHEYMQLQAITMQAITEH